MQFEIRKSYFDITCEYFNCKNYILMLLIIAQLNFFLQAISILSEIIKKKYDTSEEKDISRVSILIRVINYNI